MSTAEQKKENTSSSYGVKQSLVNKVNISSLRGSSKLSKPLGSKDDQKSKKRPQTTEKTHNISKTLPLSEKNQNVPQTPTNKVVKSSTGNNPPSTVKRTWRVPAHSGVPLSVTKSPAVSKGVTKPRSTTKRRKLPAHSGVPVSFGKRQALNFLLMDD